METGLKIKVEQTQEKPVVTIFYLRGWLDAQSEEQLLAAAREAYDGGSRYLLLDMAEIDTLTSAGIRALHRTYKFYTHNDEHFKVARVKMCNAPPQVYHVLALTGFLKSIPNYESAQAALDSFIE